MAHKNLNLRLGEEAYAALRALSQKRGASMNRVIEQEILAAAAKERKERLRNAFAKIAAMPEQDQDVEYAWDAQREVVLEED